MRRSRDIFITIYLNPKYLTWIWCKNSWKAVTKFLFCHFLCQCVMICTYPCIHFTWNNNFNLKFIQKVFSWCPKVYFDIFSQGYLFDQQWLLHSTMSNMPKKYKRKKNNPYCIKYSININRSFTKLRSIICQNQKYSIIMD